VKIALKSASFFIFSYLLATNSHSAYEVIDTIVAVVDSDVVTQSDVNQKLDTIYRNYKGNENELPPQEQLYKEVLDRLILENIQLQWQDVLEYINDEHYSSHCSIAHVASTLEI